MATVRDIVTRAFKRSSIFDAGEDLDADDAESGLEAYNEMLLGWKARGVDVNHATQTLDDTFVLDDQHETGVIAMLAVRLSDDYDEPVTAMLAKDARIGWRMLHADYLVLEPIRQDRSLANMPSQRRCR